MPNDRERAYAEYLAQQAAAQQSQTQQPPDTGRFPVVERPAFYPVQRPFCDQHSGVCVEIVNLKGEIATLKADRKGVRSAWIGIAGTFLGGALVAFLTWALQGAGG